MRLLFVGNADNPLLVDLALELKRLRVDTVIDIISERPSRHPNARAAFDSVRSPAMESRWRSVRGIKFFWFLSAYRRLLASVDNDYDAVHVFYLSGIWGALTSTVARKGRRLVVTLFGSDVYRTGAIMRPFQRRLLKRAAIITATNADTLAAARDLFGDELSLGRVVRFGLRPLDIIDELSSAPRASHKRELAIPEDRIVIVVGTNAARRQHHLEIIAAIRALPASRRSDLFMIVPMTMGGDRSHTEQVIEACADSGMEHRVITGLMTDEELARLRCAADVVIQVQPTDQLSGAMQEHLYAGSVVITGAWLPYDIFREAGVKFWTVSDRSELTHAVMACLDDLEARRHLCTGNREPIRQLSSWSVNARHWSALY